MNGGTGDRVSRVPAGVSPRSCRQRANVPMYPAALGDEWHLQRSVRAARGRVTKVTGCNLGIRAINYIRSVTCCLEWRVTHTLREGRAGSAVDGSVRAGTLADGLGVGKVPLGAEIGS